MENITEPSAPESTEPVIQETETAPPENLVAEAAAPPEPKVTASDFAKFKAKADRLRQQESEYKKYQSDAAQYKSELESLRTMAKSDPVALAEKLGLDYNELIFQMSGAAQDPQAKVQKEIESLKARLEAKEKAEDAARLEEHWENQYSAFESVIQKNDTLELLRDELDTNPDEVFSMLQRMASIAAERKIDLTFEDAAQQYEDYLFEKAKKYATKTKFKNLVVPQAPPVAAKTEQATPEAAKTEAAPAKTLNNNSSSEPSSPKSAIEGLSPRQRKIVEEEERLAAIVRELKAAKR